MRTYLTGEIVETESKPWDFQGRTGISYAVYLRTGSARDGAQQIKVKPEQFAQFSVGQQVSLPVDVRAQASDFGGAARLVCTLAPDYIPEPALSAVHAQPDAAGF